MKNVNYNNTLYEIKVFLKEEIDKISRGRKIQELDDTEIVKIYSEVNDILKDKIELKNIELDKIKRDILHKINDAK